MRYIFQILLILLAVYAVLNIVNNNHRYRKGDYLWLFYTSIGIAAVLILINLFSLLQFKLRINILGIIKFLLLIMGLVAQGLSIFQLFWIFKRRGMINQRIGSVIILDIGTIIVIFGLYYIR